MSVYLEMVGGGLDGTFLPVHPRNKRLPTHAVVWNPAQSQWLEYFVEPVNGEPWRVDVYILPANTVLPLACPNPSAQVIQAEFSGGLTEYEAEPFERIARQREQTGNYDVQEL